MPPPQGAPPAAPGTGQFVVPDPGGPPGGENTTFVPPAAPPPLQQSWEPPTEQAPPTQAPPAQPDAVWGAPPVAGAAAEAPQQWAPQPAPDAQEPGTKKKRSPVPWIIAVVIALLAAVGAFFAVNTLLGQADVSGTIDTCEIDADGALSASGTVKSSKEVDSTVEVRFDDAETGTEVDRTTVEVRGDADADIEWSAKGQAGDDVNKVTCVLGPLD